MADSTRVLIVSKGHDFDHNAFLAMFASMKGVNATLVQQPAAQVLLAPEHVGAYDCVLFYDMSGIPGIGLTHDGADSEGNPAPAYRHAIEAMLERGTGIVMLNHATVSWPNWPLWRHISGSSFMLKRGLLDGVEVPGSGYRGGHGPFPNPSLKLVPDGTHPVLTGLEDGFEITDEIYLKTAGYESRVVPLLRGQYDFVANNFTPPPLAPRAGAGGLESPARQQPHRVGECGGEQPRGRFRRWRWTTGFREPQLPAAAAQCVALGVVGRSARLGTHKIQNRLSRLLEPQLQFERAEHDARLMHERVPRRVLDAVQAIEQARPRDGLLQPRDTGAGTHARPC